MTTRSEPRSSALARTVEARPLSAAPAWSGFDLRRPADAALFLFPVAYFAANVLLHRWLPEGYARIVLGEDGLLENVQACAYGLAVWLAARTAARLWATGPTGHALASTALAAGCVLLALEELSFGQRIFGFEPPEWIRRHNLQGESNLHNLTLLHPWQGDVLLVLSVTGGFLWAAFPARWLRAGSGWLGYALPGSETTLYFAQQGLYLLILRNQDEWIGSRPLRLGHQELFETPFALGCLVHAWSKSRAYQRILGPPG